MILIVVIANHAQATLWSPVSNVEFTNVFGLTFVAVGSSLAAYLLAQALQSLYIALFYFIFSRIKATAGQTKLFFKVKSNNFSILGLSVCGYSLHAKGRPSYTEQ